MIFEKQTQVEQVKHLWLTHDDWRDINIVLNTFMTHLTNTNNDDVITKVKASLTSLSQNGVGQELLNTLEDVDKSINEFKALRNMIPETLTFTHEIPELIHVPINTEYYTTLERMILAHLANLSTKIDKTVMSLGRRNEKQYTKLYEMTDELTRLAIFIDKNK